MKTVLKPAVIISLFLIITAVPAHTDGTHPKGVKLDGTLGNAGQLSLPGPDYDISAEYGQQAGSNLFHSFQQFNIHKDESATFTGPDSVQNIISRVTGGSASWIDGRLTSTILGADLYMLNPAGIMFGKNAAVDLSGSFHVSTANYLRLGENDRFYGNPHANDVLSIAAPAAFGFLDSDISPITFEGGEISDPDDEDHAVIRVSQGRTVSLIGGDIQMKGISYWRPVTDEEGSPVYEQAVDEQGDPAYEPETDADGEPVYDEDGQPVYKTNENGGNIPIYVTDENGDPVRVMEIVNPANIASPAGQISMIAAGSESEVEIANPASEIGSPKSDITLSEKAKIDVSGTGAGSVFIRGGQLFADDSAIQAKTLGDMDGGRVDIQADDVSFTRGANINCQVEGAGRGADAGIRARGSVLFSGENSDVESSRISLLTGLENKDAGDAGALLVEAEAISFADGSHIDANTEGRGRSGDVTFKAESVSFVGENSKKMSTRITVRSDSTGEGGDVGTVLIDAKDISFADGANINSTTRGMGRGGEVTLKADSVFFGGENSRADGSDIYMVTAYKEKGAGDAGTLLIDAKDISFTDGAYINSAAREWAEAGKSCSERIRSLLPGKAARQTAAMST